MKSKRKGFVPFFLKGFLYLSSLIFQLISRIRNFFYDRGVFSKYKPSPFTISIGNIVAGGTGKTPFTLFLSQELNDFSIAILSRGYKSQFEHLPKSTIICEGNGPKFSAQECGDEAYLLANNLPKSLIIVGKNRLQSAKIAEDKKVDVILLEDGMQKRAIERDFEIVLMNANDLFGNGYFLPRGFLRENPTSLKRAHLIVINHTKDVKHLNEMKEKLTPYTYAEILGCSFKVKGFKEDKIDVLGKKVALFSGIAHPENFYHTVEALGAIIIDEKIGYDHAFFTEKELVDFFESALKNGVEHILCTEKDYVKLDAKIKNSFPIFYPQMTFHFFEEEKWQQFLKKLKAKLKK